MQYSYYEEDQCLTSQEEVKQEDPKTLTFQVTINELINIENKEETIFNTFDTDIFGS